MSATQILIDVCVLCSTGCFCFALGISLGERLERRSAHEAWGAPGTRPIGELSDESQARILEMIRYDFPEHPRPLGASRGSRSRVSVDREGDVTRMTLSDFGRFAGEAET